MSLPPMIVGPTTKDISGTWQSFMGIPMADYAEAYRSIADYGKAPADEAWVYRCVTLKAMFAQATPLRVYVKNGRERIPAEESGDAAAEDYQYLLDNVNPISMNGSDLKFYTNAALSVWGENYVKKVRGRLGGPPQELWWLRAPDMRPNRDRVWIGSWTHSPTDGQVETYQRRDIVAWLRPNLEDTTRGLSPISSIRYDVSYGRASAERRSQMLANWSVPPGAWVIPKDAQFTAQDRTLVQRVLGRLRGPKGAGKTPILPAGLTWQTMALNSRDAEDIANGKVSRMQVCVVMGVPLPIAGDDEKVGVYRNMIDAERVFARYMIGELDWTADVFNGWLTPDFDPTGKRLVVAFDYSQIEALQAPLEDRKRVALAEIEHGARTGDEYRADFRIGQPLPNDQGQVVTRLSTLVPIDIGPEAPPVVTVEADDSSDPGDDPVVALREWREIARAFKQTGDISAAASFLGVEPSPELREGMRRRYSAAQLLAGVPAERYPGLRTRKQQ